MDEESANIQGTINKEDFDTTGIEPEQVQIEPNSTLTDQVYWDHKLDSNDIQFTSQDKIIQTYKAYIYSNAQHQEQPVGFRVNTDDGYEYYIFNQNGEKTAIEILENKAEADIEFFNEKHTKGNETDTSKSSGEISFKAFKKPKILRKIKDKINKFSKSDNDNESLNSIDQLYEDQISELQGKIKQQQNTINKQNSEMDKNKEEIKTNEEIISGKIAEIDKLKIKIETDTFNYEQDLHSLSETLTVKMQNIEKLEIINSEISEKKQELRRQITIAAERASEYENAIKKYKENIYILNKENKELSDRYGNDDKEKEIERLKNEMGIKNDELISQDLNLHSKLREKEAAYHELEKMLNKMEGKLKISETKCGNLNREVDKKINI